MEYRYLECDFQPCQLYTSGDSQKCANLKIMEASTISSQQQLNPTYSTNPGYSNPNSRRHKSRRPKSRRQ